MSKYTPDDNRSMQLNPNNERYWNVREDECDDDFEVDDSERLTCLPRPQVSTGDGDIGNYIRQSHRSPELNGWMTPMEWERYKAKRQEQEIREYNQLQAKRRQQEIEDRRGEKETIDYIKGR